MTDDKVSKKRESESEARLREANYIFVRCLFALIVSIIAVAAACYAWFANNPNVTANGAQVTVAKGAFDLAAEGDDGRYIISGIAEGSAKEYTIDGETVTLYDTSSGSEIGWKLSQDSNFDNLVTTGELRPGAKGEISFYIIPHENGARSISFNLSVEPFLTGGAHQDSSIIEGTGDAQVTHAPATIAQGSENTYANAQRLLKGHLLFFTAYNNNTYSGWIRNGQFDFTLPAETVAETPVKITLYWVWPMYLDSIWDVSGTGSRALDTPICSTAAGQNADYLAIQTQLFEVVDNNIFLYGYNQEADPDDISYTELYNLRNYYNNADQLIGSNLQYVILTLKAEESTDVTSGQ